MNGNGTDKALPSERGAHEGRPAGTGAAGHARHLRAALPKGKFALVACLPWILGACASAPGRLVLARAQGSNPLAVRQFFVAGLLGDAAACGALFSLVFAFGFLGREGSAQVRWPLERVARWMGAAILGLGFVALVFSIAYTEFRLQRGAFPAFAEVRASLTDREAVVGSLPIFSSPKYVVTSAGCMALLGMLATWGTRFSLTALPRSRDRWGAFLLSAIVLGGAGRAAYRSPVWLSAINEAKEISSPLAEVGRELVAHGNTVRPGEIRLLVTGRGDSVDSHDRALVTAGAQAFGFSEAHGDAVWRANDGSGAPTTMCTMHALRKGLDEGDDPLLLAVRRLSEALFGGRAVDPIVWQVAVESFRADDIHALNGRAPAQVTPRANALYGAFHEGQTGRSVPFLQMHQSGVRTAQAHSALFCGIGYLPFNMALVRDLGNVPLRCMPEVLADAGFDLRAYYGHHFSFDNEGTFFRFHGVAPFEKVHLPPNSPVGAWNAITDKPVYDFALAQPLPSGPSYRFVATLASHMPFSLPSDLSTADADRIGALCTERSLGVDDCNRLKTLAYADTTLGAFVDSVENTPTADRTVMVLSADHSTNDTFLWPADSPEERAFGYTKIPFLFRVPEAAIRASKDPAIAVQRLREVVAIAAKRGVSNVDVPSLVLALLSATPALKSLPPAWRWHTLGAQATSADFRAPFVPDGPPVAVPQTHLGGPPSAAPPAVLGGPPSAAPTEVLGGPPSAVPPRVAFFGINAPAHVFWGEENGITHETPWLNSALALESDVDTPPPHARAPLAFLSAFLHGWSANCTSTPLRQTPRPGSSQ